LSGAYPKQQIYTINADGTNLKFLTNTTKNEVYNVKLFWSPGNSRIAYYYNKPRDLAGEQQDIYLLNINRGTAKNLTQKPRNYDEFSWLPDSQLIAFVAGEFNNQKRYTINADADQLNKLYLLLEPSENF
jgi:TolB protein